MSFVYFKFLFINTIKRKSIWITWLLFLFTCTSFIIILPVAAKMNTLQVWANTTMSICQTFMGMVAGLFTAVLAINIFKDTNEEGTELIVISKPISRFKIVLSKFILFGVYCLMINLTTVLLSVFTIFLPRTEPRFYAGLIVSMFIGNAVTFGIFGSISILLTVKFAKVGIIVVNILISLIFLIYQALTLFVFATPSKILNDNSITAGSYIIHDRNLETGDYVEDEVVKFTGTPVEGKEHPCQAKNWKEMKEFWESHIKGQDITPVLNATDLASQIALTYLSYQAGDFAKRQSDRMFGISRFYNYVLTSPASPEIIAGVDNKKSLKWVYGDIASYPIDDNFSLSYPLSFGFEGIEPLTQTRLRGYADEIPVGYIRSKEFLSEREVYLEKDEWNKYKSTFDKMYDEIYEYTNYSTEGIEDPIEYAHAFNANTANLSIYYDKVWNYFMDNKTLLDIKNIDDLNDRFIQYKDYAFWRVWQDQNNLIVNGIKAKHDTTFDETEKATKQLVYSQLTSIIAPYLGVDYSLPDAGWTMKCSDGIKDGFMEENTETIAINYLTMTWEAERASILLAGGTAEDVKNAAVNSSYYELLKTQAIFNATCDQFENYLFDSLTTSHRSNKYRGTAHIVSDTWVPYMYGMIAQLAEIQSPIPIGQNMMYFFYDTNETLKYWIFAVIWGSISVGLFTAGIIVYNKYDIK